MRCPSPRSVLLLALTANMAAQLVLSVRNAARRITKFSSCKGGNTNFKVPTCKSRPLTTEAGRAEARAQQSVAVICRTRNRLTSTNLINGSAFWWQRVDTYQNFSHRASSRGLHTTQCCRAEDEKIVLVPAFAESVSEGDVRWEKAVGDTVAEDDVVAEIETDKTSIPIPAPFAGVIEERYVEDGATVQPGLKLFKLKRSDGAVSTPKAKPAQAGAGAAPPPLVAAPAAGSIPSTPPAAPPTPKSPISSTPVSAVRPTAAAAAPAPPKGVDPSTKITGTRTEQRVKMNRMRQRIAQRLKDAQNTNAMLTTFNEIDMSNVMEMRKKHQDAFIKRHNIKMGFMSAFVKASAYALAEQPVVNGVIDGQDIVYRDYIDISVAVATPKGLVVPVLRNVEQMNYADIEKGIMALGEKAKAGALAIEDMDGGTFTISNGGVFGSMFGTPIINPPQSAILGMHAIIERPIVIAGKLEIRPMMYIALTYDHRLIDGREAVLFLRKIKAAVEDPRVILLDI